MQAAVRVRHNFEAIRGFAWMLVAALALIASLSMVSQADADYEQVPEHFGVSGEAEQI